MSGDLRLLVLHGLRLAGLATAADVAEIHDLDDAAIAKELERLSEEGLVAPERGGGGRWRLTEAGRRHGEELLAGELNAVTTDGGESGSSTVTEIYEQFLDLNQPMLDVCTTWQIVSRDPVVLNDHSDPEYDAAVIAALGHIDARIQPMCAELELVSARFGRYRPGFTEALRRLRRGETDWMTKPTILSYHTLWFQLHEDLLATLGLDRAAEAARLPSEPTIERSEGTPGSSLGKRPETPIVPVSTAGPAHHDSPHANTGHTSTGKDSP